MHRRPHVLVLGAGVSGLTTASCLADTGVKVRIRTAAAHSQTTSCAAGALWGPYLVTDERTLIWSEVTRHALVSIAGDDRSGVRCLLGLEASRAAVPAPAWATGLPGFRTCGPDELPSGFVTGWWYRAPVVDMPVYLDYLARRLAERGIEIAVDPVRSLADAFADARIVVNCTGIASRRLAGDRRLTPTRGQLLVVHNPGIDSFFAEHDESPEPTYYLPHRDHVVLGGSIEPGRDGLVPDPAVADSIRRRCARVKPILGPARFREHRVGVRPSRERVRVERVPAYGGYLVHNYGHGGAGVTLSWGCAREAADLVREVY